MRIKKRKSRKNRLKRLETILQVGTVATSFVLPILYGKDIKIVAIVATSIIVLTTVSLSMEAYLFRKE